MPEIPRRLALVAAVAGGGLIGVQGRINGELATRSGSPLEAAAASFVIGLIMLAVIVPFRRAGWARLRSGRTAIWWWFGGLGGAFFLATSAHGVPEVGVALVSVCLVAGTTTGALLSDEFGLGPSGRHAPTFWRIVGVIVVIVAVVIGAFGDRHGTFKPLLFLLLFSAGASTAAQQAANGQLRGVADDVIIAAFISFVGGTTALIVAVLAAGELSVRSLPTSAWLYLGGPIGVAYILIGASMVSVLGVLRFVLGVVAGQLVVAVVIDSAWPAPGITLRATTVIGAIVTVAGVWLSGRDADETAAESA
ncbi:MAG TPA: DMT family transporter [Mycobacteriales bacterium]|nr:DMT family transporter [Mycobacteriales bacterium]